MSSQENGHKIWRKLLAQHFRYRLPDHASWSKSVSQRLQEVIFGGSTERKGRAFSDPALVLSGMALLQDVMSSNFSQVRFKLCLPVNLRPKPFFPLQAKCIVINFHSYNVYLFGCLIFEPVSYLHHSTVTFLDLPGDYYGLRPKISLRILELSVLPFFPDQRGRA